MDWLEEKLEKLLTYIRNLSFRKAMIAYILVLAVIVWGLSWFTMTLCSQLELKLLTGENFRNKKSEFFYENGILWRYAFSFPGNTDSVGVVILDFIRTWCPFFYAFAGMIITILIFYKKRLLWPLKVLQESVQKIRENDLDFQVTYDSRDELGSLCDSVEDMRLELIRGKEEMWRLVERQKELNAAFAHDLRTPLTVLKGYTDFLARYVPEGRVSQEKLTGTLALMAEHLARLEEYSRTMKGIRSIEDVPFSPEKISLSGIRRRVEEVVFALNQAEGIEIICQKGDGEECPGDGMPISGEKKLKGDDSVKLKADDSLIMEVLGNMLSNAIRYARGRIEVASDYNKQSGEFLLTVLDDGPGFTEEQLEKALKPYYKEPEAPEADEHFGIGLHICRELCKKHGGTLSVANSIQGGAAVTASFFAG